MLNKIILTLVLLSGMLNGVLGQQLTATGNPVDSICEQWFGSGQTEATLKVSATGGTQPYKYHWNLDEIRSGYKHPEPGTLEIESGISADMKDVQSISCVVEDQNGFRDTVSWRLKIIRPFTPQQMLPGWPEVIDIRKGKMAYKPTFTESTSWLGQEEIRDTLDLNRTGIGLKDIAVFYHHKGCSMATIITFIVYSEDSVSEYRYYSEDQLNNLPLAKDTMAVLRTSLNGNPVESPFRHILVSSSDSAGDYHVSHQFTYTDTLHIRMNKRTTDTVSIMAVHYTGRTAKLRLPVKVKDRLFEIRGNVFASGPLSGEGRVLAYGAKGGEYRLISEVRYGKDGAYHIPSLPQQQYLLLAIPDSRRYAPAYFFDSPIWKSADLVNLKGNASSVDIPLHNMPDTTGTTEVAGSIVPDWSDNGIGDEFRKAFVLLYDRQGRVVSWSLTDENLTFRFNHIPEGVYKVSAEIPGHHFEKEITTGRTLTEVWLFETDPFKRSDEGSSGKEGGITVYPNPVLDEATIRISREGSEEAAITDALGRPVKSVQTQGPAEIRLESKELAPGFYLIKVTGAAGSLTERFVVE